MGTIATVTRVLIVHQPIAGGVGRHVFDIATGLAARNFEVLLCGPHAAQAAAGLPFHALDMRRAVDPRGDLAAVVRFANLVRRVRPEVIHAHSSKAGVVVRLARAAHPRTPVVYTPHGYAFAGHFSRPGERVLYREVERALSPLASRVVCVCAAEARLAAAIGPGDRVRMIHNGIDVQENPPVDPRMARLAQRGPVICALTDLRAGKGIETLIGACSLVLAQHPDVQVAVWGGGSGRESLRALAGDVGVERSIHFFGATDAPLSALAGAHVFAHPSWAESFPYAILEAMSVGLPVVASDVGGVSEAVLQGQSGLLVPARDERRLADALVALLESSTTRERMGSVGRERVQLHFSRSSMIDALIGVYSEVGD